MIKEKLYGWFMRNRRDILFITIFVSVLFFVLFGSWYVGTRIMLAKQEVHLQSIETKVADVKQVEEVKPQAVEETKPQVIKETPKPKERTVVQEPIPVVNTSGVSNDDINLIALITMAEAEGESEYGKRLVIDTILNRVDSQYWSSTVSGVIYQPNAFSCINDGRASRCYVRDDIVQLVKEELVSRTNTEVVYFRGGRYSDYGTPLFKEGNHYFSTY